MARSEGITSTGVLEGCSRGSRTVAGGGGGHFEAIAKMQEAKRSKIKEMREDPLMSMVKPWWQTLLSSKQLLNFTPFFFFITVALFSAAVFYRQVLESPQSRRGRGRLYLSLFIPTSHPSLPRFYLPDIAHTGRDDIDGIIVAGGGQTDKGPPPHVVLRLEKAVQIYNSRTPKPYIITQGRGTPHKPSPLDDRGFEIHEASMNAKWLIDHGVDPSDILEESASMETVGNAYFVRALHTDVLQLHRLVVINNFWHMPRCKAVFDHVFSVPNDGPNDGVLKLRLEREKKSLPNYLPESTWAKKIKTLRDLHKW
eukprot:766797-Hanusia_phi.AAC.4